MTIKIKYTQATVRFMGPVYGRIKKQAKESGLTVASWIRVCALEKLAACEAKESD